MIIREEINFYFKIFLIIFFIFLIFAIFIYLNIYSKTNQRNFSINEEGKVIAIPDLVEINIGLITEGENLINLQKEHNNKNNAIIKFLKENGIDNKDMKTIFYNITPRYKYYNCNSEKICPPPEIFGYTINQNLLVKIKNIEKIGEILNGVVKNGANNINNLNFTVSDIEKYQKEARKIAILKAKEKAKEIAKNANFKLGKIISFNETIFNPYWQYQQYQRTLYNTIGSGGDNIYPNIEAGSQEIKVNVNLIFEIK